MSRWGYLFTFRGLLNTSIGGWVVRIVPKWPNESSWASLFPGARRGVPQRPVQRRAALRGTPGSQCYGFGVACIC